MKKILLWTLWAALPVGAWAFHMGPGQKLQKREEAAAHVTAAQQAVDQENWQLAAEEYSRARAALPDEDLKSRQRLEVMEAGAKFQGGDFVESDTQLEGVLAREAAASAPDAKLVAKLREQLGQNAYYSAWVMRLEGAAPDEWREESTRARQHFRYLAESGPDESLKKPSSDNLEAVVRFEQMDISQLKSLPLPKQCKNCSNCSQKKREQRLSKNGNGKKPDDARDQIKKDTSSNAVNHGSGS